MSLPEIYIATCIQARLGCAGPDYPCPYHQGYREGFQDGRRDAEDLDPDIETWRLIREFVITLARRIDGGNRHTVPRANAAHYLVAHLDAEGES